MHSGSRAVPKRAAKTTVARRAKESWKMESRSAVVGEALESPTPTLERTAREERREAMLDVKACKESCGEYEKWLDHGRCNSNC